MQAHASEDRLTGRWNGVGLIQNTAVSLPSLIDFEFKRNSEGKLVAIDLTKPKAGEFLVAVSGNTFSFTTEFPVSPQRKARAEVSGTLADDEQTIKISVGAYGLSGKIEDVRVATLSHNNAAAKAFMYPRVGDNGEPVLTYAYRKPIDQTNTFTTVTPEQAGLDRTKLEAMVNTILRQTAESKTESVLILRNGKLVMAEYFWGHGSDDAHQTWSVVKSISAIVAGIAWDQNKFNLDATFASYFPQYRATKWAKENLAISVRQVLSMASGAYIPSPITISTAADFIQAMLDQPLVHPPGMTYAYDNGLPSLAGQLVAKTTGKPFDQFAEQYLLQPLGIKKQRWTYFADGTPNGAGAFFITPLDFARIGQMMLDKGVWQGKRIVSEAWIKESTQQQTAKGDYPYGFYWHLNTESYEHFKGATAFMARGALGQTITVLPDENMVVVVTSTNAKYDAFLSDYIVPAIIR
ncbi:hypothetical protein BFC17_04440 [Alteromonas lipolytica]|uniref:Beta-lactamase-related domain-containing protein n=1 Tax=Alteromonas lipolytica TaxID=1856405 RepID=A0A1E8FC65_9ALTE|nr:hypothetical protein BFC17_04440 [Alteromonas lipolytica]